MSFSHRLIIQFMRRIRVFFFFFYLLNLFYSPRSSIYREPR